MNSFDYELVVDNFAGGGGASTGIEQALGRPIDIAINHDPEAIAMHMANHPGTKHYCESVWNIKPIEVTKGRPVGLAWFSPSCTHFSKAKGGGKPVDNKIRGLAWVAIRWAAQVKPRIIMLENVEEFVTWGPLLPDGLPCKRRKGQTFAAFVIALKRLGYAVEYKQMVACDYGAPTTRKRFFLVARCDGQPIVWPEATHFKNPAKGQLKWKIAADCIDWDLPVQSIFERERPLAEATLRRIAKGIQKYVLEANEPFIVTCNHQCKCKTSFCNCGINSLNTPMKTLTAARDAHGIIIPTLIQTSYGERKGQEPRVPGLEKPLGTVVAGGVKHALDVAMLIKNYGGNCKPGHQSSDIQKPAPTVTAKGHNSLVVANLIKFFGTSTGAPLDEPAPTVMANGGGGKAALAAAFLIKYNTKDIGQGVGDPSRTISTKDGFALVNATIAGEQYAIVDIGLRMLQPHELYKAQGFPDDYIIAPEYNGKPMTKTAQVRMCGNSVPPPFAHALVKANFSQKRCERKRA